MTEPMKEKIGIAVSTVPPTSGHKAVVVDTVFMIRIWSIEKESSSILLASDICRYPFNIAQQKHYCISVLIIMTKLL